MSNSHNGHNGKQPLQTPEKQYLLTPRRRRFYPSPPQQNQSSWHLSHEQINPLGVPSPLKQPTRLDSDAMSTLHPELTTAMSNDSSAFRRQFQQDCSTLPCQNSGDGQSYPYIPFVDTGYSASTHLIGSRPPPVTVCERSTYHQSALNYPLEQQQTLSPSPYQGPNPSPKKRYALPDDPGLKLSDEEISHTYNELAAAGLRRTAVQDLEYRSSSFFMYSRSPSAGHQTIESPCISPSLLSLTPRSYSSLSASPEKMSEELSPSQVIQPLYHSSVEVENLQAAPRNPGGGSSTPTRQKRKGRVQAIMDPFTDMIDLTYRKTRRSASERVKAFSASDQTCHNCHSRLLIRARGDHYHPHYCINCLEAKTLYLEDEETGSPLPPDQGSTSRAEEPGASNPHGTEVDRSTVVTPTKKQEAIYQAVRSPAVTPTKNRKSKREWKRARSIKASVSLSTPSREAVRKSNQKSPSKPDGTNGEREPRSRCTRCIEHRGQPHIHYEIIAACLGCRLCSAGSRAYQLLLNKRPQPPYTRKNITVETIKLRRWKELELIAYLNGDDECHALIERAQGAEFYEQMKGEIEKAGGLLPPLPWL
ncbi:hypothetical protein NCC49_000800 [Naganishia albida]|nr:hypothetical protein NCC49_000800 [Naganishia albida]